nr:glycosyltransferase family 2 protein [Micromonospora sp. DSM 115978]
MPEARAAPDPTSGGVNGGMTAFVASVVVPAHDEEAGIVESVRAMLALHYPVFEVVVIDDGSTDGTFDVLERTFGLVPVAWVPARDVPVQGEIRSVHVPVGGDPLTVVRKSSAGSKTDALNAGINAARYPLLCMVDADAVLDPDGL